MAPAARPRRAQAERSASTQAQLLDAAAHLIHTRSFQGASMFEVAKAAGVTPGALQHHFGSKAELMIRLLERALNEGLDESAALPLSPAPLAARVQALLNGLWLATYSQPRFLVAWGIYFGSVGDAQVIGRVAEVRARVRAVLHQRFVQALPELAARPAPEAMVDLVLSAMRGIAVGRLFGGGDAADAEHTAQRAALASLLLLHCNSTSVGPMDGPPDNVPPDAPADSPPDPSGNAPNPAPPAARPQVAASVPRRAAARRSKTTR